MSEKDRRAADKRRGLLEVKELETKKAKLLEEAFQKAEMLSKDIEKLKKSI